MQARIFFIFASVTITLYVSYILYMNELSDTMHVTKYN